MRTLGGRLSFLLNKMQSDEESRVILKEESKKTEAQVSRSSPSFLHFVQLLFSCWLCGEHVAPLNLNFAVR